MTVNGATVYDAPLTTGFVPTIPGAPDPGPGYEPLEVPDQPGAQGDEWQVVVASFGPGTSNGVRGHLWGVVIESLTIPVREMGPQRVEFSAPLTPYNMRVWGGVSAEQDQHGNTLYHLRGSVAREVMVGSSLDGRPRWRFFCRDDVRIEGGRLRVSAVGIIGGLTADRVMGSVRGPRNRLTVARGSFEQGDLTRWETRGDAEAEVVSGGVDGNYYVRVRGTPDGTNYLVASARWTVAADVPLSGRMLAGAYVRLPNIGPEIDNYGLVQVAIFEYGTLTRLWPREGQGDPTAGVVLADMERGIWLADQVMAEGQGKWAPFDVIAEVRLHPVSSSQYVHYDGVTLVTPEEAGLYAGIDRTYAIRTLFQDAQLNDDKSDWGVGVEFTGSVGTLADPIVWQYDENPSMDELIEQVLADEPAFEVWDDATNGRNVRTGPRRGQVRTDVRIQPWNVLGKVSWSVDPGAQRTAVRGLNVSGTSVLGSIDSGAIDTTKAGGNVIDVVMQGPKGMRYRSLVGWVRQQLAQLSILQGSMSILVDWNTGMRLATGDTVQVAVMEGSAVHKDWMRVMSWSPDLKNRSGVLLVLGTDVEMGGNVSEPAVS